MLNEAVGICTNIARATTTSYWTLASLVLLIVIGLRSAELKERLEQSEAETKARGMEADGHLEESEPVALVVQSAGMQLEIDSLKAETTAISDQLIIAHKRSSKLAAQLKASTRARKDLARQIRVQEILHLGELTDTYQLVLHAQGELSVEREQRKVDQAHLAETAGLGYALHTDLEDTREHLALALQCNTKLETLRQAERELVIAYREHVELVEEILKDLRVEMQATTDEKIEELRVVSAQFIDATNHLSTLENDLAKERTYSHVLEDELVLVRRREAARTAQDELESHIEVRRITGLDSQEHRRTQETGISEMGADGIEGEDMLTEISDLCYHRDSSIDEPPLQPAPSRSFIPKRRRSRDTASGICASGESAVSHASNVLPTRTDLKACRIGFLFAPSGRTRSGRPAQ